MSSEELTPETLLQFLKKNSFEFNPSQKKICYPIVRRLYKKMKLGIAFQGIKVSENLIIDGHHRYIASILANVEISSFTTYSTSATCTFDWSAIIVDHEEWDTPAKINFLNEQDAAFNKIDIAVLQELS